MYSARMVWPRGRLRLVAKVWSFWSALSIRGANQKDRTKENGPFNKLESRSLSTQGKINYQPTLATGAAVSLILYKGSGDTNFFFFF